MIAIKPCELFWLEQIFFCLVTTSLTNWNKTNIIELYSQKSAFISLEGAQERLRAREILKVLSMESYRTDSRIRLGTGAYRRRIPFPFPTSPHHSQEGTNQPHDQSTYYGIIFGCTQWNDSEKYLVCPEQNISKVYQRLAMIQLLWPGSKLQC